jgi:hypothetical protein
MAATAQLLAKQLLVAEQEQVTLMPVAVTVEQVAPVVAVQAAAVQAVLPRLDKEMLAVTAILTPGPVLLVVVVVPAVVVVPPVRAEMPQLV